MMVAAGDWIYVIEFKLNKSEAEAMQQIENKLHMIERYVRLLTQADDLEKKIRQSDSKEELLASILQMKDTISISTYQE